VQGVSPSDVARRQAASAQGVRPSDVARRQAASVQGISPSAWGTPVVEDFLGFDESRWYKYRASADLAHKPRRSPDLVSVESGVLRLAGTVDPHGAEIGSGVGDGFARRYGRWEARFRVERGAGYGAAVLLWPAGGGRWPDDGEINLVEVPTPERQSGINAIHNGTDNKRAMGPVTADFTSWHTVAVDWLPGSVTYYLDGVPTRVETRPELIPSTRPLRLALQLDECARRIYGPFIPCRDASSPNAVVMEVDWVKVYPVAPVARATQTVRASPTSPADGPAGGRDGAG
jgi:beta-glucanase (GH16 family)